MPRCRTGFEQRQGHRVRRAAQADGVLTASGCGGDVWAARQNQGQRAGPESIHQLLRELRNLARKTAGTGCIRHVDDKWVLTWAAFGGEDFGDGGFVGGVCCQTVNSLGGQTDQTASGDNFCRLRLWRLDLSRQ